jgi:hypothetical protein
MKLSISYFVFLSCLLVLTPLYAGTQTLVTYYPAPTGNYNKIQTSFLQLGSSTLSAIQAEYKCSYDPASGLPACPAGIIYYDTDAHTLFFSNGSHWEYVVASCIPLTPCSSRLNCNTDSCGNSCGICPSLKTCSNSTPGTPGTCG